jgi:DNA-3-methyladenine glycosylase I
MKRCDWVGKEEIYKKYHDEEWGVPVYDSKKLFAKLILDSFQAGLSWITVLKKRENFYKAFDNFEPEKIAKYDQKKFDSLMQDAGIIRNRLKIQATIHNAQIFLDFEKNGNSFSEFLWSFVDGKTKINHWQTIDELPASTKESDKMSKALKKMGFKFVGTIICYAFMQAVGMVNDHRLDCFKRKNEAK